MNISERIADYYRRKQIERILRIDFASYQNWDGESNASVISRDTVIRLFLTIFFSALLSGVIGSILKPLHLPYPVTVVIGAITIIIAVELADQVWLRNVKRIDRFFRRTLPAIFASIGALIFLIFVLGKDTVGPVVTSAFESWRSRVNVSLHKPVPTSHPTAGENWFLVVQNGALIPDTRTGSEKACTKTPGSRLIRSDDFKNLKPPLILPRNLYFWMSDRPASQVNRTQVTPPGVMVSSDEDSRHYGLCWKEPTP